MLALLIGSGCAEIVETAFEVADIGHCYGCNWIVQEWHDGWDTHNSDPYDDEAACDKALADYERRDPERGFRCIHQEELIDARHADTPSQWEQDRVELEWCWRCDWRIEEWEYGSWRHRDSKTYKTQGLCEQTLWYKLRENPDARYRCVY